LFIKTTKKSVLMLQFGSFHYLFFHRPAGASIVIKGPEMLRNVKVRSLKNNPAFLDKDFMIILNTRRGNYADALQAPVKMGAFRAFHSTWMECKKAPACEERERGMDRGLKQNFYS
jgi:hypothetical protein